MIRRFILKRYKAYFSFCLSSEKEFLITSTLHFFIYFLFAQKSVPDINRDLRQKRAPENEIQRVFRKRLD